MNDLDTLRHQTDLVWRRFRFRVAYPAASFGVQFRLRLAYRAVSYGVSPFVRESTHGFSFIHPRRESKNGLVWRISFSNFNRLEVHIRLVRVSHQKSSVSQRQFLVDDLPD